MSKDQIRSASKALVPLLRRRGTSPAVGSGLRRAVQALDKALSAPDGDKTTEPTRQALAELRSCLVLMHESDRPADHEQMEGTAQALSFLAPLEAELPAAPAQEAAPPVAPSVFQTVLPSTVPAPARYLRHQPRARRPVAARPMSDSVQVQLGGLVASFDALHAVASSLSLRLADLDAAHETIDTYLRATSWLGRERVPGIVKLSREATETDTRLAAATVLVHLQEPGGAERSLTVVERAAQELKERVQGSGFRDQ